MIITPCLYKASERMDRQTTLGKMRIFIIHVMSVLRFFNHRKQNFKKGRRF